MRLLEKLIAGNNRFIKGQAKSHYEYHKRFNMFEEQKPYVAILGCSDSRVPLEIIFDENFGSIFAIRNPGNMADNHTIGSLEFAVEVLEIKLVVVLGHESCGMIHAALNNQKVGSKYVDRIIKNAKLLIRNEDFEQDKKNGLQHFALENILNNINRITSKSNTLSDKFLSNKLSIKGAFYNLQSGKVDFYNHSENKLIKIE